MSKNYWHRSRAKLARSHCVRRKRPSAIDLSVGQKRGKENEIAVREVIVETAGKRGYEWLIGVRQASLEEDTVRKRDIFILIKIKDVVHEIGIQIKSSFMRALRFVNRYRRRGIPVIVVPLIDKTIAVIKSLRFILETYIRHGERFPLSFVAMV